MMKNNEQAVKKVTEIYNRLDEAMVNNNSENLCEECGKCCDFESYDHRLFVTSPEIIYLIKNLGAENIKPMPASRCPYNIDNKCTIHKFRFAGCRIFNCKTDKDFQSRLSESAIKNFKSICTELNIPYQYTDLPTALNK